MDRSGTVSLAHSSSQGRPPPAQGCASFPVTPQNGATPVQDAKSLVAPLRLVGIAWGDPPTAMIEQDKQTYFLKVGDPIGALTVKEVLRDHVILQSGDQEVELF